MKNIILFGAGGHAKSCLDVINQLKRFRINYLVSINDKRNNLLQIKIVNEKDLKLSKKHNILIAFSGHDQINKREKLFTKLKRLGHKFPKIVAKNAYVSKNSKVFDGSIVMHNSLININTSIGKNCVINNFSLIEHDVSIGDHTIVSTGVKINGNVKIGKKCFIGSGAIISNNIIIGNNCKIGAGKIIMKNVSSNQIVK